MATAATASTATEVVRRRHHVVAGQLGDAMMNGAVPPKTATPRVVVDAHGGIAVLGGNSAGSADMRFGTEKCRCFTSRKLNTRACSLAKWQHAPRLHPTTILVRPFVANGKVVSHRLGVAPQRATHAGTEFGA